MTLTHTLGCWRGGGGRSGGRRWRSIWQVSSALVGVFCHVIRSLLPHNICSLDMPRMFVPLIVNEQLLKKLFTKKRHANVPSLEAEKWDVCRALALSLCTCISISLSLSQTHTHTVIYLLQRQENGTCVGRWSRATASSALSSCLSTAYIYIYIYTYIYIHTDTHIYTYTYMYTHIHTHKAITHTLTHIFIYVYEYIHTYIYTHIHTHTQR